MLLLHPPIQFLRNYAPPSLSIRRRNNNLQAILLWMLSPTLSLIPPLHFLQGLNFILSFLYKKFFLIKNYNCIKIFCVIIIFISTITLNQSQSFKSNMIYIIVLLYIFRLRVIGFPLSLWVGSKVGLENRDSNPTNYFLANFEECNRFLAAGTFDDSKEIS